MCELTNEEMGATHARPRELQPYPGAGLCPRFCSTTGICMWNGKPPAMCPSHTRCRIVSVVVKASAEAFGRVSDARRPSEADFPTLEELMYQGRCR